jgi:hypothetical protein
VIAIACATVLLVGQGHKGSVAQPSHARASFVDLPLTTKPSHYAPSIVAKQTPVSVVGTGTLANHGRVTFRYSFKGSFPAYVKKLKASLKGWKSAGSFGKKTPGVEFEKMTMHLMVIGNLRMTRDDSDLVRRCRSEDAEGWISIIYKE